LGQGRSSLAKLEFAPPCCPDMPGGGAACRVAGAAGRHAGWRDSMPGGGGSGAACWAAGAAAGRVRV
jgi:hypothetical protein